MDEPTDPLGPLPPKSDQRGPETVGPTGQPTGADQADVAQRGAYLTTAQGARLYDTDHSLKAGPRGPVLLQDHHLREKITHFDHERVPERVVHARGATAHGVFESYGTAARITRAAFLAEGARTPVFVRFSTVLGSRGSADTVRDTRGFATKFYTEEGVFDLVGDRQSETSRGVLPPAPGGSTRHQRPDMSRRSPGRGSPGRLGATHMAASADSDPRSDLRQRDRISSFDGMAPARVGDIGMFVSRMDEDWAGSK